MSNCTNCFNGCTEIVSDRCVKYTGINIPALGIQNGDTLSAVEESLTTYLSSVIIGVGVKIDLSSIDICALVQSYLPVCSTCNDISIVDISKALIQAACDLQDQIDAIVVTLSVLNADYTIGCLTGVTSTSDTHAIVQAVINKVCTLEVDLIALALDLDTNYVKIADLDAYIAAYLASIGTSTKYYNRMVPYAVVEFYDPNLSGKFDGTGAGIVGTNWEKIYLCNGQNGTPDKRGVVGVGVTDGTMLGGAMPSQTTPGGFNPTYTLNSIGSTVNSTTLTLGQIPNHTHVATVTINDPGHTHTYKYTPDVTTSGPAAIEDGIVSDATATGAINSNFTGLKGTGVGQNVFVANSAEGGGGAHSNVQVGRGCYYIQYRPL
jgi:hypothetical protein